MPRQFIRETRTNSQREAEMSTANPADYDDAARGFLERLEDLRGRAGAARAIGVGPGTTENIRRGRRKSIGAKLFARIQGAVIREMEKEIRTFQAEIELARQCGFSPGGPEILEAEAAIQTARAAIGRLTR